MDNKLERDIEQIIMRSYPHGEERQMMMKIFSALAAHQENFLENLEQRLVAESDANDFGANFDIAVKLIRRVDLANQPAFFRMRTDSDLIFSQQDESPLEKNSTPEIENICGEFFLDVGYRELRNFCDDKTYHGQIITADGSVKKFSYKLRRHEKFIYKEKILFELAAMYKIRRPIIFSPYARKAVELKINDLKPEDLATAQSFDLKLAENKLTGKLLTDSVLCWNVKIGDADTNLGGEVEEYFGGEGNLIRYEYFHTFDRDAKIFVLPNQHCDDLHVLTDDAERKIRLGYNSVLKERGCRLVELSTVEKISDDTFTNDFPRKNSKLRLRTEGDLEKVLACFNETRFGKIFPVHFYRFGGNENPNSIKIYRREDRYSTPEVNRLLGATRDKTICFLKFSGDANSKYKTDYANYVLHYLAQNYPEFSWAGVDS